MDEGDLAEVSQAMARTVVEAVAAAVKLNLQDPQAPALLGFDPAGSIGAAEVEKFLTTVAEKNERESFDLLCAVQLSLEDDLGRIEQDIKSLEKELERARFRKPSAH
jgi:hypothetical protein